MSPALTQPATTLRPAPGSNTPLPEWAWTTDRNALPDLEWNGEAARPPIGCRVDVINPEMGTGTVEFYTHAAGVLRLVVLLDSVPDWLGLPDGTRRVNLYGDQIIRLDQGDDEVAELPSVLPLPLAVATPHQESLASPVTASHAGAEADDEAGHTPDMDPDDADPDAYAGDERDPDDEEIFSAGMK